MAESYATRSETARLAASEISSGTSEARLACFACKRRKVKCNRQLPICSLCQKIDAVCQYPTHPEKPGPKMGSVHGSKRRRLDPSTCSSTPNHSITLSNAGRAASVARRQRNSAVSPTGSPQDTSFARSEASRPEGGLGLSPSADGRPTSGHDPSNVPIFSRIMYPSHEAQTRPQSPSTVDTPAGNRAGASGITVESVCEALKISRAIYDLLMESYFANMTAFSLFRPGSIEPKFAMMQYHSDAEALIAGIFSFSARHCRDTSTHWDTDIPSPSCFAQIASSKLDESVDRYGDMRPPFWLLQAGILVTFYQLTLSVRSRSWKKLGDCIRYAYDTNLHLVDANHDPSSTNRSTLNIQRWALLEERRRAWWAVWEMDIFASTIRRLPTAIDGSLNLTMLPVPDAYWFGDTYQESCFLAEDCSLRWKHLARSGNQSAKAWFIVMNSLMRNMQRIVYPVGSAMQSLNDKHAETNHDELNIMANCLYCTVTSLPASLSYQGETLDFRPKASPHDSTNPRQEHADKYSLHLMTQLCRFMIYHHKICARAPWLPRQQREASDDPAVQQQANSEWSNYMSASHEIVTVVRNSARDHYRYVNPFLANTLWFAAAAQCACKVFGPASFNRRLTGSNLDLLKLTIDRFIAFWGGMEKLQGKLARIEARLQNLITGPGGNGTADAGKTGSEEQPAVSRGGVDDLATRANNTLVSLPPDPGATPQDGSTVAPGTEPLLAQVPGMAPNAWADPKWSSFAPDLCDFTQQFAMTGQNFYLTDPIDFSPFGLEELLIASMEPYI